MPDPTNPDGASASVDMTETTENQNQTEGGEEQLLAGKYKSEAELQNGLLELVKQQGGDLESVYKSLESGNLSLTPQEESSETETTEEADTSESSQEEETTGNEEREQAKDLVERYGLDFKSFEQEVAENGELSQESYDKLTEVFPQNVVDTYIEGQKALAQNYVSEIHNEAGGEEHYQEMVNWASENLSQEEIDYFNQAIQSGNRVQARYAVRALATQFQQSGNSSQQSGQNLDLVSGDSPSRAGTSGYQSKQEMVRDMQDPKYGKDPAYRRAVEEKIQRTDPSLL